MRIPKKPKEGESVRYFAEEAVRWMRANQITNVIGGSLKRNTSGTTLSVGVDKSGVGTNRNGSLPPFYVVLREKEPTTSPPPVPPVWEIYMIKGLVIGRDNNPTGNALTYTEPTSFPIETDPIEVISGDKIWCKVDIDAEGLVITAAIAKGTDWLDSLAPVLASGDDSGTPGYHYIRIAEIVDSLTTSGALSKTQHLTGHIDVFSPTFVENINPAYTAGEGGNILARFQDGDWKLRSVKKGAGQLTITEAADEIEVRGNSNYGSLTYTPEGEAAVEILTWDDGLFLTSGAVDIPIPTGGEYHPWKVTSAAGGTVNWDYVGGTIYGQGEPIEVADGNIVGDQGFIYLKIERDPDSREMISAEVEFDVVIPDSDSTYQYRALAYVDSALANKVSQLQFEEIRIEEVLIVVNGEFQLAPLELSSRNIYALP